MEPFARVKGYVKINPNEYLSFENEHIKNADYSGKKFRSISSVNSKFENCKFEHMKIDNVCFGSGMKMYEYKNCSFDGSTFSATAPGHARFIKCTFRNVTIKEMFCFTTEFIHCKFGGKLRKTVFNGTVPYEKRSFLHRVKYDLWK